MSLNKILIVRWVAWIEAHSERLIGLGLVLLALSGLVYSFYLGDSLRFLPDEADYLSLAQNLVNTGSYTLDGEQPTAYRPPGYPFFLAVFQAIGTDLPGLRWLNFLLLALTLWTLYRLLCRLASPLAGVLGAAFGAGYVVLFYTAGTFYPQTLATFLFITVLDRQLRTTADENPHVPGRAAFRAQIITGLLLAWLILTIPTFIFILPVCVIWLSWRKKAWRQALVLALVALLCLGAWSVRNLLILGAPVFVSTNSGENLLLGNSPLASSILGSQVDISDFRQRAAALNLTEVERDRFYRLAAVEYWRSAPLAALKLYFEKFMNYFNFRNNLATESEASTGRDFLMLVTYYPMLLMGAWRAVEVLFVHRSVEKNADIELLFTFLYLGSALVQAIFFTRIRFRLPYDTLVIILAAIFFDNKLRQVLSARRFAQPV